MNKNRFFALLINHKSYFIYLLMFFLLTFPFFGLSTVYAQHFESPSFFIDWGNFNMTSGNKSSTNYHLSDTVGQNAPGQYDNGSLTVKAGFQYAYDSTVPFTFSIDNLAINFGSLVPGIGVTAVNTLTVSTPSVHGYQILAIANHSLRNDRGTIIPDTACDTAPTTPCTISLAKPWVNNSTYGFGYTVMGIDASGVATGVGTSDYFADTTNFRPFSLASNLPADDPQIVMAGNRPTKFESAQVTYKVNISAVQQSGTYQNAITFIAVPRY